MRFVGLFGLLVAATVLASPASAAWKCSAPGLVSGRYDGGASAYIHLGGFPSGGTYPVVKKGKVATGTTKNGTKFACRSS